MLTRLVQATSHPTLVVDEKLKCKPAGAEPRCCPNPAHVTAGVYLRFKLPVELPLNKVNVPVGKDGAQHRSSQSDEILA